MLSKIYAIIPPQISAGRQPPLVDSLVFVGPDRWLTCEMLRFLNDTKHSPSVGSLQPFGCFQPNVHLGLVFYHELCDITFYWDSLAPVEKTISKHRFLLDYNDATAFPVLNAIYWIGGRSSHVVFPRPSPPNSKLLTLVNVVGRLQMSIVPDGERPIHYPHAVYTESVNRDMISWIESQCRKTSADIPPLVLPSLVLGVCRALMVASDYGTIRQPTTTNVLGDLVVKNTARAFWDSDVVLRHRFFMPSFAEKTYKWTWYDKTTTGIYHGIPGWTRFTLGQNKGPWATLTSIDIGDNGNNVDDWNVLLSALRNWSDTPANVRKFCLEHCTGNTQVGFVNRISIGTHINGRYKPLPGFDAADTVYLFLEDLRVGPDGYIVPSKRYWSLDRKGETPMPDALKTLYNFDQSETWDIRKSIRFFDSEQFAALDQLRIQFGGILRSEAPHSFSGTWRHVCSPRKRSQSLTRLQRVNWRTEWMWEDQHRADQRINAERQKWWLKNLRKQRPELFTPGSKLEQELNKEEVEVPTKRTDLVRRLHRSKTKSVGGGLSLIFSRIALS